MLEAISREPGWHAEHFGLSDEEAQKNAEATVFLEALLYRRYAAKLGFELEFWGRFREDGGTPDGYSERLGEATGVRYRPDGYLADMDAGFYSADYLRAWIRSAQLREYLAQEVGSDWWRSTETGDRLRALFSEGTKPTSEEIAGADRVRPARHRAARLRAPRLVPDVAFDRFYRYDELTEILQGWAEERPELFRVESIGNSFEGRDIWLATVTNFDTGADLDKPAMLVEANIHALEVTGTTAALHLLDKLLTGYGSDPKVTRCLDSRVFYVVPRLNPDGAELALVRQAALRPLERPALSAARRAGRALRGGHRRRRPHPDDAPRGSERRLEGASRRAAADDPARSRRGARGRHVLPAALGGHDPQLRRRDDQDRAAARGARPEPKLPGRVGARGRAAGRGPVPALRARDASAHGGDRRAPEHHGLRRVPHVLGRPPPPVQRPRRRALPDPGSPRLQAHRRGGDEAHRLPGDLDLPRVQVRAEAVRSRARRRTGSTTTSASSRGRRSSGARSARPGSRTTATSSG